MNTWEKKRFRVTGNKGRRRWAKNLPVNRTLLTRTIGGLRLKRRREVTGCRGNVRQMERPPPNTISRNGVQTGRLWGQGGLNVVNADLDSMKGKKRKRPEAGTRAT